MAASLLIEEESGTYSSQIRHSHNGYYAGDFSQAPRPDSEPRVSYAERYEAPRAWLPRRTDGAKPRVGQPRTSSPHCPPTPST
jgi:hypothetical protein